MTHRPRLCWQRPGERHHRRRAELLGAIRWLTTGFKVDRAQGSFEQGFTAVFQHGMRHIDEGTDHLPFLLALLLPAPLGDLAVPGDGQKSLQIVPSDGSHHCRSLMQVAACLQAAHSAGDRARRT
jgi:hypothetical protein